MSKFDIKIGRIDSALLNKYKENIFQWGRVVLKLEQVVPVVLGVTCMCVELLWFPKFVTVPNVFSLAFEIWLIRWQLYAIKSPYPPKQIKHSTKDI